MNHTNTQAKILSLDLATTTGWAFIANGVVDHGAQSFKLGTKKADPKHAGLPFAQFDHWIINRIHDYKPELIVYEEVRRWMSTSAAWAFCGFRSIMLMDAAQHGITCIGYSPTTIKKFATGSGAANKNKMIETAKMRWPDEQFASDDAVDAMFLLHLHLAGGES